MGDKRRLNLASDTDLDPLGAANRQPHFISDSKVSPKKRKY